MSTKREEITLAVLDALAGTVLVGDRIHRTLIEPLKLQEFPALDVSPLSDSADTPFIDRTTWTFTFQVRVMVRDNVPDEAADPIIADVHYNLINDSALQALVVDLKPVSIDWQFFPSDTALGLISMQFRATYQTSYQDQES